MRSSVSKTLVACGLVIMTGPLCFTAVAQYVDLEAERAAAQAAGGGAVSQPSASAPVSNDPYGAQPAQAYPATSYGVNNAPAAPSSGVAPSNTQPSSAAPAASTQAGGSDLRNMYLQMQQLQQEVMRLNGRVEEQAFEINTLKEQSLQRYMDLDKRLGGSGGASPESTDNSTAPPSSMGIDASAPLAAPPATTTKSGVEQPGEATAYRAAYALVQGRQFEQAIPAFKEFLQRFPNGAYAANAHYWLGELYLVKEPPDLEASRQSFVLLLSQYPDDSKVPAALYKLGKVQFMKGNREKAKEYLDLVISQYSNTDTAVVKLAREFIAQNY